MSSNTINNRTIYGSILNDQNYPIQLQVQLFEQILDSVSDICFILSPDGGYIDYCNRAAAEILGYQYEELKSMAIRAVISYSILSRICDTIHHLAEIKEPEHGCIQCDPMPIELIRKDRKIIGGHVYCFLSLTSGTITTISGHIRINDTSQNMNHTNTETNTSEQNVHSFVHKRVENAETSRVQENSIPGFEKQEKETGVMAAAVTKGKILIMDDEDILIDIAQQMGRRLGLHVDSAKNGEDAIRLYREALSTGERYDAVLLDMTIAGDKMGGLETADKLYGIDPEVKTVIMSGYADHEVMSEPEKYGFKGVISKPFRLNEFSGILHSVIPEEKFITNS